MNVPDKSFWRQILERPAQSEYDDLTAIAAPAVPKRGNAADSVSWSLRVAAAWAWRFIMVVAASALIGYGLWQVSIIVIPLLVALLMTLFLDPLNSVLRGRLKFPRALAAGTSVIVGISVISLALGLAGSQIVASMGSLVSKAEGGLKQLAKWAADGPLHMEQAKIDHYTQSFVSQLQSLIMDNTRTVYLTTLSFTSSVLSVATILLISLFCLFFFLKDGRVLWVWMVRILPIPAREPVHEAGIRGWMTLKGYIKAQVLVAAVDSVCIAIGALLVGVPLSLVIPLLLLVFLGSFVPIVGALFSGAVAVLVALVDQGWKAAIIMLVVIILVQQVEGNILQPLFMSNAVSIHPLVVLLAVAGGTYLAGIVGALFSVPLVAFINTVVLYLTGHDRFAALANEVDRPGGPPGTIHAMVAYSFAGKTPAMTPATSDPQST